MPRVICAGHVNWDVTLRVDRLPARDGEATIRSRTGDGGGSAANVACALAGLGVSTGVFGSVGDDDHGRAARTELTDAGVDCSHLRTAPDEPTTVKYLAVGPEGGVMLFGCDGANESFDADDFPASALAAADHLHLTSQNPETAARLAERATAADVPVSFDPGRRVGDRPFTAALARADVVFLNDREAEAAADPTTEDALADGTVVRTQGCRGAEARTGGRRVADPGFDAEAVDTSGAGDAFAAGFVAARLDGADLEGALRFGNACGALAAETVGARTDLSREAVETLLAGSRRV